MQARLRANEPAARDGGVHRLGFSGWSSRAKLEAEVAALKSRGVKFEDYDMPGIKTVDGIATAGGAKIAWFKDTEGNTLAVSQQL